MKNFHKILSVGLLSVGTLLIAGSVTIPNTFSPNTTAKAVEVNANFNALKTAVNDNNSRIGTNETDISNKVASVTAAASGGLEATRAGNDVVIKQADGFVSIHPSAFQTLWSDHCQFYVDFQNFHFVQSTSSSCTARAAVILPDGAKPTSLKCYMERTDTSNSDDTTVGLHINEYDPGDNSLNNHHIAHVSLPGSHTASGYEKVEVGIATNMSSSNEYRSFFLKFDPPNDTNTANASRSRVGSCMVGYSY